MINNFENKNSKTNKIRTILRYFNGKFGEGKPPKAPDNFKEKAINNNNLQEEYITNTDLN